MRLRYITTALRVIAATMVLVLLVACGEDEAQETSATPPASAQAILRAASTRLGETQALHFALDVTGQTYIDPTEEIQLLSAEGDLARPNMVRVQFQVRLFSAGNVSIRMVTVGQRSWTTDLLTGSWGPAPVEFGYDPTILFDNQGGLGPVMNRLNDPALQDDEDLDGRSAFHIVATADEAAMGPLTGFTMKGEPVGVELWIDQQTSDLLRITLNEPASSGKGDPATWVLTLSEHGERVEIEPPV